MKTTLETSVVLQLRFLVPVSPSSVVSITFLNVILGEGGGETRWNLSTYKQLVKTDEKLNFKGQTTLKTSEDKNYIRNE
jgi:hypothetical protein